MRRVVRQALLAAALHRVEHDGAVLFGPVLLGAGCPGRLVPLPPGDDAGSSHDDDAGHVDAGRRDGGLLADAGAGDAGDAGPGPVDGGHVDGGWLDAGSRDAGLLDAGLVVVDAGPAAAQPDFSLVDVNPTSPRFGQAVSPRDYLEKVSGWYFGHAT